MALGKRLKQRRQELDINLRELSEMVGASESTIHGLEIRDSKKTSYSAVMAKVLGVRLSWLVTGEEPMLDEDNQIASSETNTEISNLGKRIRYRRKQLGMTLKKLAEISGLGMTAISNLEIRDGSSTSKIFELAQALGVRPEWLLLGEEPMISKNNQTASSNIDKEGSNLGTRLKQRRKQLRMTLKELAELADMPESSLSGMELRGARSSSKAKILAKILGVRLSWLVTGEEPMLDENNQTANEVKRGEYIPAYDVRGLADGEDIQDNEVFIPYYAIELSAGNGTMTPEYVETKDRMPFKIRWLESQSLDAKNLKMMKVRGDSMLPTLGNGDAVLIDTSDVQVIESKVYAVWIGNEARVKRLRYNHLGDLIVMSDNSDYLDETIPADELNNVYIIGRVRHKSGCSGL